MRQRLTTTLIVMAACILAGHAANALSDPSPAAQAQQARHGALKDSLAQSPFRRPLLLRSASSTGGSHGEIYAVMDHPFDALGTSLQRPENWCALLILQTNIKRCATLGSRSDQRLQVAVARRYTDRADEAHAVELRYALQAARQNYVSVELAADQGPVATRNYSLRIEAVPIGAGQTFVHLSYAYETGMAARWATNLYLAAAGREKGRFQHHRARRAGPSSLCGRHSGRCRAEHDALLPGDRVVSRLPRLPRLPRRAGDAARGEATARLPCRARALPRAVA